MTKTYYVVEIIYYKSPPLIMGITSKLKRAAKLADNFMASAPDDAEVLVTRYSCDNETGFVNHRCCLTNQDLRNVLARSA